jgi:hypothetical protein
LRLFFRRKSEEEDFLYLKEAGKAEAQKEAAAAAAKPVSADSNSKKAV